MKRLTYKVGDELICGCNGVENVGAHVEKLATVEDLLEQYNIPDLEALETLLKANADGRVVVLTKFGEEEYNGLKVKYRVFKARNGEPVEDCFVLRPTKDRAAWSALFTYANDIDNAELSADLREWLDQIVRQEAKVAGEGEKQ